MKQIVVELTEEQVKNLPNVPKRYMIPALPDSRFPTNMPLPVLTSRAWMPVWTTPRWMARAMWTLLW